MSRNQKKNAEEKVKIVRQYLQGEISITRAAELGGVDWGTAKQWIRNYESEGVAAFAYPVGAGERAVGCPDSGRGTGYKGK